MVGIDGTSAYNDVAVAAIAFTLFHLLQIWDEERDAARCWPRSAWSPASPSPPNTPRGRRWLTRWASSLVKNRKAVLPVAACAALMMAPWLLKNWIYLQNPVAPFFNRQFPNPYVMAGFEDTYRRMMAMYHLKSRWQIPMEVTTYGSLSGLLGPVFLLVAAGLLALRRREGRQLCWPRWSSA